MSAKEWDRLKVLQELKKRHITQKQAAAELGLSVRWVHKLLVRLRAHGDGALRHRLRGRPSNRKTPEVVKRQAVELYREKKQAKLWHDYGPTLAAEELAEQHGIAISRETLRRWLIEAQLWRRRRARVERAHVWRARRGALLRELGVEALFLGVGVDRVDYTKGILERFLAIERMLEKHPTYQGKFTFVQIGAPSRTHIKRYHDLLADVEAESERINWRFQTSRWKPIVFSKRHYSHKEIQRYYQTADLCLVTSLHDGMNLVAKEFVAARHDEQGVLDP